MGVRATTDDDAMSSTLGKNCMCTCLMRLSFELTRRISNVLNFGWETLLPLRFRELIRSPNGQLHQTRVSLQGRRRDALE